MVMELTIIPLEGGCSISSDVADLVKLIESGGLDCRMTAFGTLVEGSSDQLMDLSKQ